MSASSLHPNAAPPTPPQIEPRARPTIADRLASPPGLVLLSVVFFFAAVLLSLGLAFDWFPGYPESAQKNVAIYYQPSPKPTGLAAYLHPPLNSIQANGQSQLLAFQFTNYRTSTVLIRSIQLFSADCFHMEPQGPIVKTTTAQKPSAGSNEPQTLLTLDPDQSALLWYRLSPIEHSRTCPGQSPLVFLYVWQQSSSSPRTAPVEQQSISTGPIRLTTPTGLHWERFFTLLGKIVPLILLPVLLAIGNYVLEDLRRRKADVDKEKSDQQASTEKERAQKLEVWKTMIPSVVEAIRNHYVPIVRILSILETEADFGDILICVLLFRSKITHLVDQNGGFYFRNARGEELSATLANKLNERSYALSGNRHTFLASAERLEPVNSFIEVRETLSIDHPAAGPFANLVKHFQEEAAKPEVLRGLRVHATFLRKIMEHEINDPFFPFWYDLPPTILDPDELRGYVGDLGLEPDDAKTVLEQLDKYLKSVPAETLAAGIH